MYLSTALAALGCGNPKEPQQVSGTGSASATTVAVATSEASATATGEPSATATIGTRPAPEAPFSEVLAERPPLDVPAGLDKRELTQLTGLKRTMEKRYRLVGKVWRQVPGCDPAACEPEWQQIADDARAMFNTLRRTGISGCGGPYGITGTHHARSQLHFTYLRSLTKRIEAHLGGIARSYSFGSERKWQMLLSQAKRPVPMPCLSPCRTPALSDITNKVMFAKGSVELRLGDEQVKRELGRVLSMQRGFSTRATLMVRGHADASEKDASKLALARAKAVQAWLIAGGLSPAQISVVGLDTRLPVAISGSADDSSNVRVDFLVVPTER